MTMFVAGLVVAFTLGWKFAFVCIGLFPFIFVVMSFLIWVLGANYKHQEKAFKASSTKAEQALASIKVVAAFGQEQKEEDRFNEHLEEARVSAIKFYFCSSLGYGLNNGAFMFVFGLALLFGALFVTESVHNDIRGREYTPGDIVGVFFGIMFGAFSLSLAAPNLQAVTKGRQATHKAITTIEREPLINIDDTSAKRLDNLRGEIEFEDVHFKYKTRQAKALQGVNIKFEQGKITALVGPSGSGKSTIVQLMERFYDPDEGRVLIDGDDLKAVNLRDFRSMVGYVSQEPVLFNQTIRENLRYGKPDASDEEMYEALKSANASKIIDRLPDKLDTVVGAQGGKLSGGEKQRIALARAFIKNPKILILDEATSALDRQNEEEVQEAIDNLKNGDLKITTIVIAHRLSTIRYSDKIVVLKDGKVAEEGDHDSLLKNYPKGVYSDLVSTQEKLENNEDIDEGSDSQRETPSDEEEMQVQTKKNQKKRVRRVSTRRGTSYDDTMKSKKAEADQIDKDLQEEKDKLLKEIEKKGYFKRLLRYNKPYWLIAVGLICSAIQGMTMPLFGLAYVKVLFAMFDEDMDAILLWSLIILII